MANPLDSFSSRRGSLDVKVRPIPRLADYCTQHGFKDGTRRFDEALEIWRQDLQRILPSDETVTTLVTTIINTVNTSTGGGGGTAVETPPFDPSALIAQINALSDALADHIAQVIVHGTESPVVGETDEQALERKTIGFVHPRDAKFRHMIQSSRVEITESFTIPVDYNSVVAGPFVIDGEFIVDGAFVVV